jgi:phosphoglucosamine mutase
MERSFFGTDGIRGPSGGPVVNEAFFDRLGEAVGRWAAKRLGRPGTVVIGRDTRASGAALMEAFGAGVRRSGGRPLSLGVVPTPAVSRAATREGVMLGTSVTASHNPASDNGIKFFGSDGAKLTDEDEAAIESSIGPAVPGPLRTDPLETEPALQPYIEAATAVLAPGALRDWPIVLDTANGATCLSSPAVFRALGARVTCIGNAPDGENINLGVGSEHPEGLAAAVLAAGARLGVAHDGDGDRCVVCDERGSVLDGDEVLAILATHALSKGTLSGGLLVVTVQSNLGLDAAVAAAGGRVLRTPVGDRYVALAMRAHGAVLGGESSGHIICSDLSPTGDGLAAALRVAGVMADTGRPLSELRRVLVRAPQETRALLVREKRPLGSLPVLSSEMAALERELGASGRILVRYSGTEPRLRLLVEAADAPTVRSGIARLEAAARRDLEVL